MTISLQSRLVTSLVLATTLAGLAFVGVPAMVLAAPDASSAPAAAAPQEIDPAQLALARKYVDLTNKGQIYEVILVRMAQKTSNLLVPQNPDQAKKINDTIGQVLETYKGKNDELFNQFARIYATQFTTAELQQMVDFYSSPTGQKLASSATDINGSIQKVMEVYTYNLGTEFVAKVKAALKSEGITP